MSRRLGIALAILTLGLSAGALVLVVEVKADLAFIFPRTASPDLELMADRLQRGPSAGLILISLSGPTPDELVQHSSQLADRLEESGHFLLVANGRARAPEAARRILLANRYLLNPPVAPEDFEPAALRRRLEQRLASLGTSSGLATKHLLPADPTDRFTTAANHWLNRSGTGSSRGVWLSRDGTRALLMVRPAAAPFDLAAQAEVHDFIRKAFHEIAGGAGRRLSLSGPSVFAVAASRIIGDEIVVLTLTSAALVMALLLLAFRSPSLLLVLLLPLGFGVCAGTAAVQLVFGHIHGIALAFGATLIGVSIDYPIHLVSHTTGQVRHAVGRVWPTLRLGMLTTAAAFIPFTVSSFPGLAQIGLFTIVGILAAGAVSRGLLPAILPARTPALPGGIWKRLQSLAAPSGVRQLVLVGAGLAALAYLGTRGAELWESDLRNLSPTPAAARSFDRLLREEIGAPDVRYLLVLRGQSVEDVLRRSESLDRTLSPLAATGKVAGFDMAARYLPSAYSQRLRQQALPDRGTLEDALAGAAAGLPFRPGLFAPFLDAVESARSAAPLTLADFEAAGLGWWLEPLVFRHGGDWIGLIVPRGVEDPAALRGFVAAGDDPGLSFLDLKEGSERLVADYRDEALIWLAVGAVIAVATLGLGLRSPRRALRVVLPTVLAVILTVTALSLAGIALSLFHLLALLLVGGIGLDYALFFERSAAGQLDRHCTLRANLLCAMTSVTVFTVLAFSRIPVLHGIGMTVALGASLSFLLGLALVNVGRDRA